MIPTKRKSPFTRTRSFQPTSNRHRIDTDLTSGKDPVSLGGIGAGGGGPPFSKRPAFSRTMSTPFQVLSPTMTSSRNPFEKLAPSPTTRTSPSITTEYASLRISEGREEEDIEVNTKIITLLRHIGDSTSGEEEEKPIWRQKSVHFEF